MPFHKCCGGNGKKKKSPITFMFLPLDLIAQKW